MIRLNDKGTVLVSMLLLLAVVTILCIVALNMTTVEIQIMGNLKKTTTSMNSAEGGLDLSIPIIETTLQSGSAIASISGVAIDVVSSGTRSFSMTEEILGKSNYYTDETGAGMPNLSIGSVGGVAVYVDIDRMYSALLPGGSMEFASGYEGIGVSAGGGGVAIYYRIDSVTL